MTQPRNKLISIEETPYYHVVSRCVRRAYLCGEDRETGQCYEHRRQWIVDRIRLLSSVFAIDICGYAVLANHYHMVVKLGSSKELSQKEVLERWLMLQKGTFLVQQFVKGGILNKAELKTVENTVNAWRERLQSLSWFMKYLNEPIARQANKEDDCTGHFWESRFKSQALLTDEALLSCMAYVDLNPVRARLASTPEESDYTSIQERIAPQFDLFEAIKSQNLAGSMAFELPIKPLLHFDEKIADKKQSGIPFSFKEYLQLVDWTGRAIRLDKRGSILENLPPILSRLGVSTENWLINSQYFEKIIHRRFKKAA